MITVQHRWRLPEQTITIYTEEALSLFHVLGETLGIPVAADSAAQDTENALTWANAVLDVEEREDAAVDELHVAVELLQGLVRTQYDIAAHRPLLEKAASFIRQHPNA